MGLRARLTWVAVTMALVVTATAVSAAERVTIAMSARGIMDYTHVEVAHALGYFAEQGLDVDLQYFGSGTLSTTALLSGTVDFNASSFDQVMKTAVKGKPLTAIAALTEVPGASILVASRHRDTVRDPAGLKGRSVAVSGLGAYSHLILLHVLARSGLEPGDVEAIPVGTDALAAALENGRVDAMMAAGMLGAKLVETGRAYVLVDLRSRATAERLFGGPYLKAALVTRPEVCAQKTEICARLARGIVKAARWIEGRASSDVAAALPMALVQDRRLYAAALDENRDGFSRTARIDPRAVDTVIASYRTSGAIPPGLTLDPSVLYDNRFVDRALAEVR